MKCFSSLQKKNTLQHLIFSGLKFCVKICMKQENLAKDPQLMTGEISGGFLLQ